MMISEAGRALARHKEQKAFIEFQKHSWTVFDNNLYARDPVQYALAATTGVDFENNLNGTMSVDDYLDIIIALYNNGYTPTDVIMHALAWPSFVKNGLTGVFTGISDKNAKEGSVNSTIKIGPEAMAGKLPFALNVNLSPFAPINKINKTFDMFAVDKDNVGILLVKDDIKTEEFREPARDLNNLKMVERYGFSTKHEGRAVTSAKNISLAKGYPTPQRVYNLNSGS